MREIIARFDDENEKPFDYGEEVGEIIRCIDCKYYVGDGYDECELMSLKPIISAINRKQWYSDFYCAFGEREEE